MSRISHDYKCSSCGSAGKVPDDVIICPQCGESIEGMPVDIETLDMDITKVPERETLRSSTAPAKEAKG